MKKMWSKQLLSVAVTSVVAACTGGYAFAAPTVTLTVLTSSPPQEINAVEGLAADFMPKSPSSKVEVEARPAGGEGDNIVKTRLATGEMADVFLYNSGSLFQALNPKKNLVDVTNEPFQADVHDTFKKVVSVEGKVYGAPIETGMGGGVLYNRKIYQKLNLQVPKTWAEFQKNNAAIKAAGIAPVIQTFKDTWTSQLFVLGDYFNVQAVEPDFADRYTNNKAKFATSPTALKGFQKQEEVFKAGYLNKDFASAGYEDGLRMVAKGEGAHYPMLTFAIGTLATNFKENLSDVGFFALPGDNAAKNGLTVWVPPGLYIPKTTQHLKEAKMFLAFAASVEGCNSQTKAVGAMGPYMVKGCELPTDVPPSVKDLVSYFGAGGQNAPALEFLSPIKGPSLEQITVEVGSGIRKPADGAALYDEDVRKQAMQLGIAGWK